MTDTPTQTRVVYQGPGNFRELAAADLDKAGVSGFRKTTFEVGVPVKVNQDVATALTTHTLFEGEFRTVADDEVVVLPQEPMTSFAPLGQPF